MMDDLRWLIHECMANILIPAQHQSSPKEHPADQAIRQAREEIASGQISDQQVTEEQDAASGMGIALGLGEGNYQKPALEDFQNTAEENMLSNHPRVIEALEKMRHEVEETKGHELIERNCALRELTMASESKNRWDGQGRWMGAENEEMRYGEILSPQQFYDRLGKVVGKGKLKLSEHVMFPHEGARSGLSAIMMRNPLWDGEAERYRAGEREQALKMAEEANKMFAEVKSLSKLGRISEAKKKTKDIAAMVAEARQKYDLAAEGTSLAQPEFVRVATVQWPLMTEWMILSFTEWGTVWKPKFYGWRTALLTMIQSGAITEVDAHKAFPVGIGEASAWYLQQIFDFQNGKGIIQ
jgi:hypothetical protein